MQRWNRLLSTTAPLLARTDNKLDLRSIPLRVAVIGSGPAGFYAASRLLQIQNGENLKVDMFEELPVPFGLVRYGVAPDHPEVKNCEHKFELTASDPRFRFFGNVQIGGMIKKSKAPETFVAPSEDRRAAPSSASIPISVLQKHYHAILYAYGASHDRVLGISGENLGNVYSARSFVHLYNGHPYSHLLDKIDLSKVQHVTIIGQGNVALDCARMLLTPADQLRKTDTPEPTLAELARSNVKHVSIVGRRGPLQFQGTTKELREMMQITDTHYQADPSVTAAAADVLDKHPNAKNARMKKRLLGLMRDGSKAGAEASKSWSLEYLKSPREFRPHPYSNEAHVRIAEIDWETNELVGDPASDPEDWKARGTGGLVTSKTDLVLTSIGYRSIGIPGLPFDDRLGIVKNINGRILESEDAKEQRPLQYTSGWLARGPNGVLTTTMMDAFMTAEIMAEDLTRNTPSSKPDFDLSSLEQGHRIVSWQDWQKIDAEERKRGSILGKSREKMLTVQGMLGILT